MYIHVCSGMYIHGAIQSACSLLIIRLASLHHMVVIATLLHNIIDPIVTYLCELQYRGNLSFIN